MKVLAVVPVPFMTNRGNPLRVFSQLNLFNEAGYEADVATYPLGGTPTGWETISLYRAPWSGGATSIPVGPSVLKVFYDIQLIAVVIVRMIKGDYDVIYAYNHEGVAIATIAQMIIFWKRLTMIADIQGILAQELEVFGGVTNNYLKYIFSQLERALYRIPKVFVASSPEVESEIKKWYPTKQVIIIGDEVHRSQLTLLDQPESKRKGIVYTGGFTADKGVEILLEMFGDSYFSDGKAELILAGGPAALIKDSVDRHPHSNYITIVESPNTVTVDTLIAHAFIACDPKYRTTGQSSGKLARYLAHGIPIVAFDTHTNRYYLGGDYAYVPSTSMTSKIDPFTQRVKALFEDKEDYQRSQEIIAHRQELFELRITQKELIHFLEQHIH